MGLSAIDFLTGILNRRAFQKSVEDEMYKKTPGVFIFIDVDNFKSYNDTYGHNNGDFCLKHFAETMKKCFPAESIIGRYGGDEFVVYLKNLTVEEVQNYMADFQRMISHLTLPTGEQVQLSASARSVISFGLRFSGRRLSAFTIARYKFTSPGPESTRSAET